MKIKRSVNVSVLCCWLTSTAVAQTPEAQVIVTGTLIRGIAPESAPVIGLDEAAIEATGAMSTVELLTTVPQLSGFQQLPSQDATNETQVSSNRVNLRSLPGEGSTLMRHQFLSNTPTAVV
jgi:hypothetical protein